MHRRRQIIETTAGSKISSNGVVEESEKPQPSDDILSHGMSIVNVRERMERLRQDVVNNVGDQFDGMMSDIINDLDVIIKFESTKSICLDDKEKLYCDKRKPSRSESLPEKQYLSRNSVLTDLYEIKHFKTLYNIFTVIFIMMCLNTVIYDLLHTGLPTVGMTLMMRGFAKFSVVIKIWLVMTASTFGVYGVCNYWAQKRVNIQPKSYRLKIWDYSCLVLFVAYQITLIIVPAKVIVWAGLPPVSSLVVLTEQIRMMMKTHAFVRSAVPLVTSHKLHSDKKLAFPAFSKFLYFMFAPTLIYRDTYPRTREIRWRCALWHLSEVLFVMFNMASIFERYFIPSFEEFGKHPFDLGSFVLSVWGTSLLGAFIFLSGFYCLLHAWMNAAAEIMRFGDRLFYKDWWNATTYSSYYRNWNVVVHDWLYTYIYKDMYEIVTPGNRLISTTVVFFISAIFHEYILTFTFGFLFPMLLLAFGVISFFLMFIVKTENSWGNMFLWYSLCTGPNLMISLYSAEYFSRINCPPYDDGILDLIVPRSFLCAWNPR